MFIEPVLLVYNWLNDATYGVNAKLPSVPTVLGDSAPSSVALYHEFDSMEVASGRFPAQVTCLTISTFGYGALESEIPQFQREFEVTLLLRYQDSLGETEVAKRRGAYTFRAALRSLAELSKNDNSASRLMNNVGLRSLNSISPVTLYNKYDTQIVVGGMMLTYAAVDLAPIT
jgi:hypothetical protein